LERHRLFRDWVFAKRLIVVGIVFMLINAIACLVDSHIFSDGGRPDAAQQEEKPSPISTVLLPTAPSGWNTEVPLEPSGPNHSTAPATPSNPETPIVAVDDPPALQSPASRPAVERDCALDDGEIPAYLNLAERYRNRGKYERAISSYRLVIDCQPGNRQAQQGLRDTEELKRFFEPG
jgi:hypothetical protein